jgi:hypothetical protein
VIRTSIILAALLAAPLSSRGEDVATPPAPTPEPEAAPAAGPPAPEGLVVAAPAAAEEKHGVLPFWGDKVRAKGFTLPKPYGVMVNYYWQRSDIKITNLKLGINGGPLQDASFIQIPSATTQASALAVRPSVMILPFFSVYGVFSSGATETHVNVTEPFALTTTAKSGAQVLALGGTLQMAYKGIFGVADFNASVSDVERLADTVGANMLSFRLGYNKQLNAKGRGIAVWAGTAGQVLGVDTKGSVALASVLPPPSQGAIDNAQARCDSMRPGPRKDFCNQVVGKLQSWANGQDPAATVQYSLEKRPVGVWNLILGGQYALDRDWQFRFETTFLNGRTSFLSGVEYRFDII